MAKIAFIGKEQIIGIFKYFGTAVFQVSTSQEADAKLQELVQENTEGNQTWGIVYLEESLAEPLKDRIIALNRGLLPVISIFPASGEKKGMAGKLINDLVRKVTGVELRFE
jgi:vacuolar-type H+-ATPase subunit F/Vma7